MDPTEERSHSKKQKDYVNMLSYTCDSEYGIPRRCACGGRIIDEVRVKQEYDTQPGKRFFTCANHEVRHWWPFRFIYVFRKWFSDIFLFINKGDGFHYRQPWVIGVQEQIESLTKRLEEAEQLLNLIPSLKNQIETLEVSHIVLNYFIYFSVRLSLHFALLLLILITYNCCFHV